MSRRLVICWAYYCRNSAYLNSEVRRERTYTVTGRCNSAMDTALPDQVDAHSITDRRLSRRLRVGSTNSCAQTSGYIVRWDYLGSSDYEALVPRQSPSPTRYVIGLTPRTLHPINWC